jgi:phosphoglycolate phosphatase
MDILIDLDGTLVDPKAGIIASVQYALKLLGHPVPPMDELTWVIGPPLRDAFPKLGVPSADVERAVALYRENYSGSTGTQMPGQPPAMFNATVYPGIEESLSALRRADCRLIVCTSKPHVFAKPIIREKGLADYFAAIHGAELDGTRDDKAELIAHIIKTEHIDPTNALMVGDRKFDILGAKKNGLRSIGVTWGYGTITELREADASALCDQPKGLHRLALWMLTGHG